MTGEPDVTTTSGRPAGRDLRVALVTCTTAHLHDPEAELIGAALVADGIPTDVVPWDAEVDWAAYGLVVLRSTWDYFDRLVDFLAWASEVDRVSRLVNPVDVVRWNSHKGYLVELGHRGVPTVPTRLIPAESTDVADQLLECPWDEVVVKAAVDGGGRTPRRGRRDDVQVQEHARALSRTGDVVVQPFVPGILQGERSLVFLDGALSHTVLKVPAEGAFLSQRHHGASEHDLEADSADLRVALAAIAAAPGELAYARIDVVDWEGSPAVMEVEAIEPDLFLRGDRRRMARFVEMVRGALAAA